MFDLDLAKITNNIWWIFEDIVPEGKKLEKADAVIDLVINDYNDLDSYREIAAYAEHECLRQAAENNVKRIVESRQSEINVPSQVFPVHITGVVEAPVFPVTDDE